MKPAMISIALLALLCIALSLNSLSAKSFCRELNDLLAPLNDRNLTAANAASAAEIIALKWQSSLPLLRITVNRNTLMLAGEQTDRIKACADEPDSVDFRTAVVQLSRLLDQIIANECPARVPG